MMEQRTEMLKQMRVKQNVKEVCAFTLEILGALFRKKNQANHLFMF